MVLDRKKLELVERTDALQKIHRGKEEVHSAAIQRNEIQDQARFPRSSLEWRARIIVDISNCAVGPASVPSSLVAVVRA
jgi:hypothetical protein